MDWALLERCVAACEGVTGSAALDAARRAHRFVKRLMQDVTCLNDLDGFRARWAETGAGTLIETARAAHEWLKGVEHARSTDELRETLRRIRRLDAGGKLNDALSWLQEDVILRQEHSAGFVTVSNEPRVVTFSSQAHAMQARPAPRPAPPRPSTPAGRSATAVPWQPTDRSPPPPAPARWQTCCDEASFVRSGTCSQLDRSRAALAYLRPGGAAALAPRLADSKLAAALVSREAGVQLLALVAALRLVVGDRAVKEHSAAVAAEAALGAMLRAQAPPPRTLLRRRSSFGSEKTFAEMLQVLPSRCLPFPLPLPLL